MTPKQERFIAEMRRRERAFDDGMEAMYPDEPLRPNSSRSAQGLLLLGSKYYWSGEITPRIFDEVTSKGIEYYVSYPHRSQPNA